MKELIRGLSHGDLYQQTNEMVDKVLDLITGSDDYGVTFVPKDPDAFDDAAVSETEIAMPWTLGHVIVHTTASAEESAALAAELSRGVPFRGGRSHSEVHWTTITTLDQCVHRLEESRRMRLASLDMWPDKPDLINSLVNHRSEEINAIGQFMSGLTHEFSHLDQIGDIIAQAHDSHL
ncbi:MAG: DinB family protein [Anaerolineae bacterium]|nr:MAG: DinB family protein [Anaerolineae bacterium]